MTAFDLPVYSPDWFQDALCAEVGGDEWFPDKGMTAREAKAVCASCEVRVECLQYALDNDIRDGIWGGLSWEERKRLPGARPTTRLCATPTCTEWIECTTSKRYCAPCAHRRHVTNRRAAA